MCMLMARGAVVSTLVVVFILPALLLLCDRIICATTARMRVCGSQKSAQAEAVSNIDKKEALSH